MKVLSLFDGMSCGQIALRELGVTPDVYFASEVDRHAIAQTRLNFPDTVHLGDVRKVSARDLPPIDLLMGGSPCTDFSFAGKRRGMATTEMEEVTMLGRYEELKRDGFEFVGQSYLFWEYVRILHECREKNPGVLFLLENVEMGRDRERVIDEALGIRGVHINSALVSAQNRRRIYWTNIRTRTEGLFSEVFTDIPQPEDKGLLLKDILEPEKDVPSKYDVSPSAKKRIERLYEKKSGFAPRIDPDKSGALTVGGQSSKMSLCASTTLVTPKIYQRPRGENKGGFIVGKTPTLTACAWEQNNILCISSNQAHATVAVNKSTPMVAAMGMGGGHVSMVSKLPPIQGVSVTKNGLRLFCAVTLQAGSIRRLTPTECARLQTIPDWYKWECSESQQYKMLGNGWTVEVIKHILSFIDFENLKQTGKC